MGPQDPFLEPDPWAGVIPEPVIPLLRGGGCGVADPNCVRCTLDGTSFDCSRVGAMLESGAAVPCPDNDCGPRLRTVTAHGRGGRVIATSSEVVLPHQPGWDGSFDGRYRRTEVYDEEEPWIAVGRTLFQRVSGGGPRPSAEFAPFSTGLLGPQKSEQVFVPLVNFKKLLQERLNYGDCQDYIAKLISKAAELSNGRNDAVSTDIMTLYRLIHRQPRGGFLLNALKRELPEWLQKVSGGSGLATGGILWGNATAIIFLKGAFSDSKPLAFTRLPYDYGISGLHEIIHLAGKNGTYSDALLTRAARELEPSRNYGDWDSGLKDHCLPAEFR